MDTIASSRASSTEACAIWDSALLKTPPQSSQANARCERLLGTLCREYVDFVIPLSENHLRCLLTAWVGHYNVGRPHMSLGLGIPQPSM
jgi:putative transposase